MQTDIWLLSPILINFCFPSQIAQARKLKCNVEKNNKPPCLIPDLRGKTFHCTPLNIRVCHFCWSSQEPNSAFTDFHYCFLNSIPYISTLIFSYFLPSACFDLVCSFLIFLNWKMRYWCLSSLFNICLQP